MSNTQENDPAYRLIEHTAGISGSKQMEFSPVDERIKKAFPESTEIDKEQKNEDEFLLHLVDVVACFAMEQNMYYSTPVRKELIQKARETFKPDKP